MCKTKNVSPVQRLVTPKHYELFTTYSDLPVNQIIYIVVKLNGMLFFLDDMQYCLVSCNTLLYCDMHQYTSTHCNIASLVCSAMVYMYTSCRV